MPSSDWSSSPPLMLAGRRVGHKQDLLRLEELLQLLDFLNQRRIDFLETDLAGQARTLEKPLYDGVGQPH